MYWLASASAQLVETAASGCSWHVKDLAVILNQSYTGTQWLASRLKWRVGTRGGQCRSTGTRRKNAKRCHKYTTVVFLSRQNTVSLLMRRSGVFSSAGTSARPDDQLWDSDMSKFLSVTHSVSCLQRQQSRRLRPNGTSLVVALPRAPSSLIQSRDSAYEVESESCSGASSALTARLVICRTWHPR